MKMMILLLMLIAVSVFVGWLLRDVLLNEKVEYYSIKSNGKIQKTDSIIVYPLQAREDVKDVWPVYYAFIEIEGIRFKTMPFLFSDNPAVQGEIDGRMVYYIEEK